MVLQRRVRARGLPSRRDRRWLGLLELMGCLLTQLRCGCAERREAVQQPHVSEHLLLQSSSGPYLGEEPSAALSPRKAGDHHLASAVVPLSASHSKAVPLCSYKSEQCVFETLEGFISRGYPASWTAEASGRAEFVLPPSTDKSLPLRAGREQLQYDSNKEQSLRTCRCKTYPVSFNDRKEKIGVL